MTYLPSYYTIYKFNRYDILKISIKFAYQSFKSFYLMSSNKNISEYYKGRIKMNKAYIRKRFFIAGACIFLAFFFRMTTTTAYSKEASGDLNAFYPAYATFSDQVKEYMDDADTISFAWSKIDSSDPGTLNTEKGKNNNYGFYYPQNYTEPIEYAKSKGKTIQLSVYMDGKTAIELLPDKNSRATVIKAITEKLDTDITQGNNIYFDGVVIDFEGLKDTGSDKKKILYNGYAISYYYNKFLEELKQKLDKSKKKLYVAVNPRLYYDGYDYSSILKLADRVILMAHDYDPVTKLTKAQVKQYLDYDTLKPIDSLTPFQRIREALNDLQSAASDPSLMSKVMLQLAFDTAQWQFNLNSASEWDTLEDTAQSTAGRASPLYQTLKARLDNQDGAAEDISYGYNNELQSPYLQFYNASSKTWNVIIYEDSSSISAKIDLAKSYGVGGISIWALHNVPNYTDKIGMKYKLDVWSTIIDHMNSYNKSVKNSSKLVTFSDSALENAVRQKLGKTEGDISVYDVKGIYRLKLSSGVKTLKDLKYLTSLEYLDAQELEIKDIAPLGKLTNLRVLYLQNNCISDISALKKLTKLEILDQSANNITSIEALSGLTKLKKLSLQGNSVKDLKPLAKLTSLQKLDASDNKISSIKTLKKLKKLTELYLEGNKISDYSPVEKQYNTEGFLCDFEIE
jgi:internalin A